MQTITTKYHGATDTKAARISATATNGKRVYLSLDFEYSNDDQVHAMARDKLCDAMNWNFCFATGTLNNKGHQVHVIVNKDTRLYKSYINIIGNRCFIRGNTYHTVKIYVDDKVYQTDTWVYGYGEHYLQTAKEMLVKAGIVDADEYTPLWQWCDDNKVKLTYRANDVKKKDLFNF